MISSTSTVMLLTVLTTTTSIVLLTITALLLLRRRNNSTVSVVRQTVSPLDGVNIMHQQNETVTKRNETLVTPREGWCFGDCSTLTGDWMDTIAGWTSTTSVGLGHHGYVQRLSQAWMKALTDQVKEY